MALSEFEIKRMEKLVGRYVEGRRPRLEIRSKFDLSFHVSDQSFEIFTIRPRWDDPEQKLEEAIAKATYVKSRKVWKLFWMRSDMKWHVYEPFKESSSLEKILEIIEEDAHSCFWG